MVETRRIERVIGSLNIAVAFALSKPTDSVLYRLVEVRGGGSLAWAIMLVALGVVTLVSSLSPRGWRLRLGCMIVAMLVWTMILWIYLQSNEIAPAATMSIPIFFWAALRSVEIWQERT